MTIKSHLLYVILTFSLISCGPSDNSPSTSPFDNNKNNLYNNESASKSHTYKDLRKTKQLVEQLQTNDLNQLKIVFNALSSCKDETTFSAVMKRLKMDDIDEQTYIVGVNALGNISPSDSVSVFIKMLYPENLTVPKKEELLTTLGKIGSADGLEYLLHQKSTAGSMEGIYRSVLTGLDSPDIKSKMVKGMGSSNRNIRFWSAHTLLRLKEIDLTPDFEFLKDAFEKEEDMEVKIALAGIFKHIIGEGKSLFMRNMIANEKNPLILANLIRSLKQTDFSDTYNVVLNHVGNKKEQVAITALSFMEKNINPILIKELIIIDNSDLVNGVISAKILKILAADDPSTRTYTDKIDQLFNQSKNNSIKAELVRAMAGSMQKAGWLKEKLNTDNDVIQGVAHECLLKLPLEKEEKNKLINMGLTSENVALICQSAIALRNDSLVDSTYNWGEIIDKKIKALNLPRQLEALVELQNTKAQLLGNEAEKYTPSYNHPMNWSNIGKLPSRPQIELLTTKGKITWELYLDKVPAAVSSIVNLIDSGFYDRKTFHRIVPNFVAQGGCPRGDGWGSLDFSLRSEYDNEMKYTTGAIGLASAGENTESCQFFMCHSPTPHLDNRYTIIGYVTDGYEVLNSLGLGDEIISMKRVN